MIRFCRQLEHVGICRMCGMLHGFCDVWARTKRIILAEITRANKVLEQAVREDCRWTRL